MISIVDYGIGNIRSIQNALTFWGVKSQLVKTPEQILNSKKLILPGVGSFKAAMKTINEYGLQESLNQVVIKEKIPIFGICLGMQLLSEYSEEDGHSKGFGWIKGSVSRFPAEDLKIKVPHVGFNSINFNKNNTLFKGLGKTADFYFVHSYRLVCKNKEDISGITHYGEDFVASVERDNIFGIQFHPEKSQSNGLRVLKNFCDFEVTPRC